MSSDSVPAVFAVPGSTDSMKAHTIRMTLDLDAERRQALTGAAIGRFRLSSAEVLRAVIDR